MASDSDDFQVIDAMLADAEMAPPQIVQEITERRCYRHDWKMYAYLEDGTKAVLGRNFRLATRTGYECARCGKVQDEVATKRGRSSRRLGHDGERRSEKRYGWRKTGEFGGIDDLVGTMHVVQQKTTRSAPPLRWKGIFARLDERAAGRIPLILLSFVKAGVDTEDFIIVRGKDWLALHGKDGEA